MYYLIRLQIYNLFWFRQGNHKKILIYFDEAKKQVHLHC